MKPQNFHGLRKFTNATEFYAFYSGGGCFFFEFRGYSMKGAVAAGEGGRIRRGSGFRVRFDVGFQGALLLDAGRRGCVSLMQRPARCSVAVLS